MKNLLLCLLLFSVTLTGFAQNTEGWEKLYVGTFTSEGAEGIYLCNFNPKTGDIQLERTFKAIDDPSFLKISPDKKYIYVAGRANEKIEKSGGYIYAYKIEINGDISFLNKQISHGKDPCHVDVSADGKFVAVANYTSGTTALYPVAQDGTVNPACSVNQNEGSGPDKSRQASPHAHSIKFSPFDSSVFSADLGTDQLDIFLLKNEKLTKTEQKFVKIPEGSGPRHFDFHPNGEIIYVINELNSTVSVVKNQNGEWKVVQNISSLPGDFTAESYCADVHISNDARFLYGSNRGHNSVTIFAIDNLTQKLTYKGTVGVEGNWPRNFTLSPDNKFMLVANQRSGNITVFKINEETGFPEFTGKQIQLPAPVCLEFLN
ncbi:lactonase family protein [Maribellus maritimus]|uniref:lactonase family protein n=1 Tax=Maribellus maritimus TaxID=2870838 RepID=UPI001EEC994F|nr:lactonase family protein [Maribellus maritimus]MCG6185755.1 lactonase family protein [Maribellus maritimus]